MVPLQVLKDIDAIDQDERARKFWEKLWPFLERTEAPLVFELKSDGFAVVAGYPEDPMASLRLIERANGEILCVRFSNMPRFLATIGTIIPIADQNKATSIYRRVVDHMLAA